MFELNPIILGISLLLLGSGSFLITLLILRVIPRFQPKLWTPNRTWADRSAPAQIHSAASTCSTPLDLSDHQEAVLLVQAGGRITYLNQEARKWFRIWDEEPNLEHLARRARPSETFLSLCAGEGRARLSVDGRYVEGTSYLAPNGPYRNLLVSLRHPAWNPGNGQDGCADRTTGIVLSQFRSDQLFKALNEWSQTITASLDLEKTLQTILEGVERLIPADFSEITLWEAGESAAGTTGVPEGTMTPYRFVGLRGVDRRLEKALERYRIGQGYSGYLFIHRTPLLIGDVDAYRQIRPAADRQRFPFRAYLGLPLMVAGDFIGTLELASLAKESFSKNDLEMLRVISGQAAVAVHNALLYRAEQHRARELAGLANLAQAVSALRDPQDLIARLNESIAPLLGVEILGFFILDENLRLQGQVPFLGIPSNVLEFYQSVVQPGGSAEESWQPVETIVTTQAPEDARLEKLGLRHLAIMAGIHHTVLAPLTSGGRMLGYLQAANKRDGTPFNQDDLRLLAIITGQAAPILENSSLVQQSRRRAQRAETLRRIASLTSSSATLEEILKYSLLDLARLLQADMAAIFLLDEQRGELRVHKGSLFGVSTNVVAQLGRIPVDDPQFLRTVTGSQRQFLSGNLAENEHLLPLYCPLVETLHIQSAIDVPLVMRERGIGELMLGSFKADFFNRGDLQSAATAAGQLAAAIEQAALSSETDQSLRQRIDQMTALTRIGRAINSTLDLEHLLQRVYAEILHTTRADCGTILVFEIDTSATHDPQIVLHLGDVPGPQLNPMEQTVLRTGEPLVVDDFEDPAAPQPAGAAHPGVRSALIVPIAYQGRVAGLIHLHATAPGRFDAAAREIVEMLAIQAAIALGNATRYQEQVHRSELLNLRVDTLTQLFETSRPLLAEQPLEKSLQSIVQAIQAASPFDRILISVYDPQAGCLQPMAGAGLPDRVMSELRTQPASWSKIQAALRPEFRQGQAYWIPYQRLPAAPTGIFALSLLSQDGADGTNDHIANGDYRLSHEWQPGETLILPVLDTSGEPLGVISVAAPRDHLHPDILAIEALEIFGSQTGLVIENQRRLHALQTQVGALEQALAATGQVVQADQDELPTLLPYDQDKTIAIQHIRQQAWRTSTVLEIAAVISSLAHSDRTYRHSEVLLALGQELLARMNFDMVLVTEVGREPEEKQASRLRLLDNLGNMPAGLNPEALLGQRNPLRHSVQTGEPLLIADLQGNAEWQNTPLLHSLEGRSFISLPVMAEQSGAPLAAVLAVSRRPLPPFTKEDEKLFHLLTRQVTIALQNLDLLDATRRRLGEVNLLLDFSRLLGSLDPSHILCALVESTLHVLPNAQAGLVALWDPQKNQLIPQAASGYANNDRMMAIAYQSGEALPGQAFLNHRALRIDEVDLTRHYNLSVENMLLYRDATGGRPPVSSLVIPLRVGEENRFNIERRVVTGALPVLENSSLLRARTLGVLVLDNFQILAAFSADDQALITSLAQQTALTLENARLYQAAEQRARHLQALTVVASTITSSLQTDALIANLLDQLQAILPYENGTLWLRAESLASNLPGNSSSQNSMIVRAARGFADSDQRVGLTVALEDSLLLKEMLLTGRPISVANVQQDPRFPAAMEYERLSWLGVPLVASGEVIGVIALEKIEANFYTPEQIQVAMTFASQAAVGLENANLYQESVRRTIELDRRSQRLAMLNRLSMELSKSLDVTQILGFAARELHQAIGCSSISALLFGSADQPVVKAEYPAREIRLPYTLPDSPLFDRIRQTFGIYRVEDIALNADLAPLAGFLTQHQTRSLLVIPLVTGAAIGEDQAGKESRSDGKRRPEMPAGQRLEGLLLAHSKEVQSFATDEVELARTICNQVAIAVQNARLFTQTRQLTEELEQRVLDRTAELAQEHKRTETLLRIITELSASLDLEQVLRSTLHTLNQGIHAEQVTVLIVRPGEKNLHRLASIGYTQTVPSGGNTTPFDLNEGLASWVIKKRQAALVDDVLQDPRWVQMPNTPDPQHRSALAVPLLIGAEALGTLMLFHTQPGRFSIDQLELVQAVANQVAVAVNNAELYRLIRDQAEDLGAMLRRQQVETSRTRAILEAVADGVLVTDANKQITLFNASAESILNLDRSQVLEKSLDYFTGLFGRAAQSWRETIDTWSQNPASYQPGDTYSERITLDNKRVVAVRLAPVRLRTERSTASDFLGTVSIFQDITHQVEVDRLKSEFVGTVSHELRTPMTSIKGYAEVLLMGAGGALNEKQRHFIEVIRTNSERLVVLVNDLLDISRIEAGRATLTMQPLNLEELADGVIADLLRQSLTEHKPVTVSKEIPARLPRILGDFDRVRQIIENLLDNAYHYNIKNGHITVRMSQVGEAVRVDIHDTGMGIPPAEQPRIFERFFRGESPLVLGVSGTGLGLSIVQYLIEMHHGRIWLESSGVQGEGSTFSFTLPIYAPEKEQANGQHH